MNTEQDSETLDPAYCPVLTERYARTKRDTITLIEPPLEGEQLEPHHIEWFLDQVANGAPPYSVARQIGRPMTQIRKRMTELGNDLEEDMTLALKIQALQRAANGAAIADGPANPNYRGDGDVKRDKLRLDHNERQLATLTKLTPTKRVELSVSISIADNLKAARGRLNKGQDVQDATIIEPSALPMPATSPTDTVFNAVINEADPLAGL